MHRGRASLKTHVLSIPRWRARRGRLAAGSPWRKLGATVRPTVFLFDIDGTLVDAGGAGRRAFVGAFTAVVGRPDACNFSFAGMTDPAIARRGLRSIGHPGDDAAVEAVLAAYVDRLPPELAAAERYRVHPGAREIAEALGAERRHAVGLGTGNLERGAYEKLRRGGLDGLFAFGGFGSDAEDRPSLVRVGARRGAARLGVELEACRVVVVGDTTKDVAAARAIGAECLAVRTGGTPGEVLAAAGATVVVHDLAAPEALAFLEGR